MSEANRARGAWGERTAAQWYRRHGYEVVAQNWRCAQGEIDLIARRGDEVVVAEVKTRRSDTYGAAVLAVDGRKQARLRRLAMRWRDETLPGERVDMRFDVVAITGTSIEVFVDAF
jgi:putative endonuclease